MNRVRALMLKQTDSSIKNNKGIWCNRVTLIVFYEEIEKQKRKGVNLI